jgi:glutamate-1-semialdehyde 2,1-aminomutase
MISSRLASGLAAAAAKAGVPLALNRVGSMLTCFFTNDAVTDYASAKRSDTGKFARFFRSLLERGVYFPPSQFEAAFVSTAHSEADVASTVEAAARAFEEIPL